MDIPLSSADAEALIHGPGEEQNLLIESVSNRPGGYSSATDTEAERMHNLLVAQGLSESARLLVATARGELGTTLSAAEREYPKAVGVVAAALEAMALRYRELCEECNGTEQ